MKNLLRLMVVVFALALLMLAGAGAAAVSMSRPPDTIPEDPFFRVEPGEGLSAIASRLEERGFLRSRYVLIAYARLMRTEGNLQTGYYQIPEKVSMKELHDLLLRGRQYLVSVTIPEGYTLRRLAALLSEKEIVSSASQFIDAANSPELSRKLGLYGESAEGYLYPDTYRFALDTDAEILITHMVETFFNRLEDLGINPEDFSGEEFHEKIILASIIEREYRVPDEAPLIASVFYNRLKMTMPLQSCATVVYVLTEQEDREHPRFITYADLEVESPFNTYRHYGLPPAPICNPGSTALDAAFFPEESDYLYFLVENPEEGRHRFTRTLSEHNAAKRLYIKSN
jgi:peptidoglycan lytic transglycosylase G